MMDDKFLSDETFNLLLLHHGWPKETVTYTPVVGNREVIGQIWDAGVSLYPAQDAPDSFFSHFGNTTFRKLLRFLFDRRRCTYDELKNICGNERKLAEYLVYLVAQKIAEQVEHTWRVGSRYEHILDIGKTLEWYVTTWFHLYLHAPARFGVKLKGMPKGGDLDVIAFVGEKSVLVECKSRRIDNIEDEELHLFLQRVALFQPAIALLLVDTERSIKTLSERIKRIYVTSELIGPENMQAIQWNTNCVEVTNTRSGRKGIDTALQAIFAVSHRDRDKPLVGLSSLAVQKIKGVLPGLNKDDSLVMKLLCEKAIATYRTIIDTEDIREEAQQLNISQEALFDAIEMLMVRKYTQGQWVSNGSSISVLNEPTISGFEEYARTFRDDYPATVKAVALLIVNTTPPPNSYELVALVAQPQLIIDHILKVFQSKELIKLHTSFIGLMVIYNISPELKRAVRDGKEL